MPSRRILLCALTLLLLGGPLLPAAQAGGPPARTVTSTVVKVEGRLIFKGRVEPGHANRAVWIQRKTCRRCEWAGWRKVQTDENSRYRSTISPPRRGAWFYRAKVRAYGGFATSYSGTWRISVAS